MMQQPEGDCLSAGTAVDVALRAARQHLTRSCLLRRSATVVAVAAAAALLAVVADHAWPGGVPRPLRVAVAWLWAGGFGLTLAVSAAWTLVRKLDPLFVARHLERAAGIGHNALVNALLVRANRATAYAAEGAARQAAGALRASAAGAVRPAPASRKATWGLAAVLLAWLLYAALTPKPVLPSLARFLGADLRAPTATRLELLRPAEADIVHAGEQLTIEVAVRGRPVDEVTFELLADGGAAARVVASYRFAQRGAGDEDRRTLALAPHEVTGDLHFRCRAGDARLEGVIPVQPQPDVAALRLRLDPPDYTGEATQTVPARDLHVWKGTRARIELEANVEVRDPVFVFRGVVETRTRMVVSVDDPRRAAVDTVLRDSGSYRIEFTDRWGYASRDRAEHRVTVREDAPPVVRIVSPAEQETPDGTADVGRLSELVAAATDDIRVSRVVLVHERDGLETRAAVAGGKSDQVWRKRVTARLATAGLPLEPGQSLRVWFEAYDNRVLADGTPAAQMGASRVVTLVRPVTALASKPVRQPDRKPVPEPETATGVPGADAGDKRAAPNEAAEAAGTDEQNEAQGGREDRAQPREQPPQPGAQERARGEPGRPEPGADSEPAKDGADDSAAAGAPRTPTDEAATQAEPEPGPSESEFERAAATFEQEHGDEAREVARRLRESREGRQQGNGGEGQRGDEQSGDQPRDRETGDAAPDDAGAEQPTDPPREQAAQQPDNGQQAGDGESGADRPSGEQTPEEQAGARTGDRDAPDGSADTPARSGETKGGKAGQSSGGAESRRGQDASGQTATQAGQHESESGQPSAKGGAAGERSGTGGAAGAAATPDSPPRPGEPGDGDNPAAPPAAEGGGSASAAGRQELLGLLELLERGQPPTEEMLSEELGWSAEKAAAFLRGLARVHAAARRAGVVGPLRRRRAAGLLGTNAVQAGRGVSGGIASAVGESAAVSDALEQIAPPPEQRVSPALQPLLDAYYRALAERRAAQAARSGR